MFPVVFFGWTCNLILCARFLRAQSDVQVKLRARKIGHLEINLSSPVPAP